jgi:hypothetical protein
MSYSHIIRKKTGKLMLINGKIVIESIQKIGMYTMY